MGSGPEILRALGCRAELVDQRLGCRLRRVGIELLQQIGLRRLARRGIHGRNWTRRPTASALKAAEDGDSYG